MAEISKVSINDTDYLLKSVSTQGIPYGDVTSNSTTVFTATVPGVTELRQGTCCLIRNNNKQTSASGWTLNVNDLGAKPVYNNMADATRDTTIFNKVYTMLFVYDEDRVDGGCWICYRGYNSDNNTIGYQLRTNSTVMNVSDTARYYKLYFTSADNTMWVPASSNSTNNATAARAVNQRPINPFGRIVYTSASTNYTAGSNLAAATIWDQYALSLGYSFNRTGAALSMTVEAPVYVKCAPQADGSAIMDATTPIVQALPSTADGKIYIYLGVAYSAVNIELVLHHPVYYHDGTAIRIWTGANSGSASVAWNDITGKPTFATVATSGDYDDLSNKPTIPTVPTNVSAFTNDAGYLTSYTETDPAFTASAAHGITSTDITNWNGKINEPATEGTNGQILTTNGNGGRTWTTVSAASDAQVTTAVNTWLGANVAQETGYVLDRTLSISNAAAPADLVGELKSAVSGDVSMNYTEGKALKANSVSHNIMILVQRCEHHDDKRLSDLVF